MTGVLYDRALLLEARYPLILLEPEKVYRDQPGALPDAAL